MNLILESVNDDNYDKVVSLHVAKGQEGFIETTEECLQEAKEFSIWKPTAIYHGSELIGFAMYGLFEEEGIDGRVWLDRLMIGHEYQGKGYGKESLRILINQIYKEYNCDEIFLSIYDDNDNAIEMYKKIGFKFNGELDINGEKVMVITSDKYKMGLIK